jgi:hypothetical protein
MIRTRPAAPESAVEGRPSRKLLLRVCCAILTTSLFSFAEEADPERFRLFGDFRFRLEQDWDSLNGDGTEREDRLRARIRVRVGFDARLSDQWSTLVQLRTGPHLSQQSPHITIYDFDGGDDGPYQVNFDRWFVRYANKEFDLWAGRNELSYVHRDDLFVFDNVTYAGLGGSYSHELRAGRLIANLNLVALPVGMRSFVGNAAVGQVAYDREFEDSGFTVAGGFFLTKADPDDPDGELLLTDNNTRDYRILQFQFQYRNEVFRKPVRVGLDFSRNVANYGDAPSGSFSEFHKDHVSGFAVEFEWGSKGKAGDLVLGYEYAHLEALAGNSSYIQDDWVRWGNANQVRATNIKGSEFRLIYTLRPNMNLFARLFFVRAIDLLQPGDTTRETGNRFRVDYNVSF